MTEQGMKDLYARAAQTYNRAPQEHEFRSWMDVLGGLGYADVDAALRRWMADTELDDFTQRPRGAKMPSPAELKLSVERFDRANGDKFKPCGTNGCVEGWVKVSEWPNRRVKRCQCFLNWALSKKQSA